MISKRTKEALAATKASSLKPGGNRGVITSAEDGRRELQAADVTSLGELAGGLMQRGILTA